MGEFNFEGLGIEELLQVQKKTADATEKAISKAIETARENGTNTEQLREVQERIERLDDSFFNLKFEFDELKSQEQKPKYIQINELPKVSTEDQHENFEDLLICVQSDIVVLLVGEAGSGKTTGAHNVAKALELNYSAISVGAQTGTHQFFGFIDANGNFIETEFYKAYKHGGLFLIDELDAGNAGVLTSINSALANGSCAFACGMVEKHKNFRCIGTANTYGNGATLEFIGRNAIDGATKDRFAVIDWNIDESLELKLCKDTENAMKIQRIRRALKSANIKHIVSTRAIFNSEKLLSAGMTEEKVYKYTVWKGLDQDTVNRILKSI